MGPSLRVTPLELSSERSSSQTEVASLFPVQCEFYRLTEVVERLFMFARVRLSRSFD